MISVVNACISAAIEFGGQGPLSCRLARRQTQAGQKQLAVLGMAQRNNAWYHNRGDRAFALWRCTTAGVVIEGAVMKAAPATI